MTERSIYPTHAEFERAITEAVDASRQERTAGRTDEWYEMGVRRGLYKALYIFADLVTERACKETT